MIFINRDSPEVKRREELLDYIRDRAVRWPRICMQRRTGDEGGHWILLAAGAGTPGRADAAVYDVTLGRAAVWRRKYYLTSSAECMHKRIFEIRECCQVPNTLYTR